MQKILLFLFLLTTARLFAEDTSAPQSISIKPVTIQNTLHIGDEAIFALEITIPKDSHLFANPMGPGIGKPFLLTLPSSQSVKWLGVRAKAPEKFVPEDMADQWSWVWKDQTTIFVSGRILHLPLAETLHVDGLLCQESCQPQHVDVKLRIPANGDGMGATFEGRLGLKVEYSSAQKMSFTIENSSTSKPSVASFFLAGTAKQTGVQTSPVKVLSDTSSVNRFLSPREHGTNFSLLLAMFFAFIAGIILNFMPCVLPVLGIKILSFSKGREGGKAMALKHSFAFAAGMVSVFLALATLAVFAGLGWGEQFQNPVFMVVLIALMFVFGLGMFDLFVILVPSKIGELDSQQSGRNSLVSNALKGAFATILATPCSGPFLGATLAWTLIQKPAVVYLVFIALGAGMASPYILLASSSRLSKLIPKPGAWMEIFKHALGFFLFAYAVYLCSGLPATWIVPTFGMLVAIAAAAVFGVRIAPFGSSALQKLSAVAFVFVILVSGYEMTFGNLLATEKIKKNQSSAIDWLPFTNARLAEARATGRNVLIDFTASWCLNCQYNKIRVYQSPEVEALLRSRNVLVLEADFTTTNEAATALQNRLGSKSIPFLAIFNGKDFDHPVVMRDIVSKRNVITELTAMEKR